MLKKPPGAQLGFNIRGGKASQLGIFISKVSERAPVGVYVGKILDWLVTVSVCVCVCWQVVPDSDAHRAGLQEGDQVLSVNDVDFQDIEHSRVSSYTCCTKECLCHPFLLWSLCIERLTPSFFLFFLFTLKAVEILKTAREILMRVRFFPYSKFLIMVNFEICLAFTAGVSN